MGIYKGDAGCAGSNLFYTSTGHAATIVGAGIGKTILTCDAGHDPVNGVISLSGPATLTGVTVQIPAGDNGTGISLNNGAVADGIAVDADPTSTNSNGVNVRSSTLTNSTVALPAGDLNTAINDFDGSHVDGVTARAGGEAVAISGGGTVSHAKLSAPIGVTTSGPDAAAVYDSLIDVTTNGSFQRVGLQIENTNPFTGPLDLLARNVTVVGGAGSVGADSEAAVAGQTSTLTLTDSIVKVPAVALERNAVAGATANITTSHDDYPDGAYTGTGPGSTTQSGPPLDTDPGFVDAAHGNYRLDGNSPLIDAGTPGTLQTGEPASDLAGAPRILDGKVASGGACVATRDIGAYEFTPSALSVPSASATPSSVATGQPVTFTAAACDPDPAASVTYTWAFDDGTTATGATVSHAFTTAFTHQATVIARDSAGGQSNTVTTVVVQLPAGPRPPVISALRITPSRFGSGGATVTYSDSEAAHASFTVLGFARGVFLGGRCLAPGQTKRRGLKSCTRTFPLALASFTHNDSAGANRLHLGLKVGRGHLRPGRYLLSAVPILPGPGVLGTGMRAPFTVLAPKRRR